MVWELLGKSTTLQTINNGLGTTYLLENRPPCISDDHVSTWNVKNRNGSVHSNFLSDGWYKKFKWFNFYI